MGDLLAYPDTGAYTSSCASYWSRQEAHLSPGCIVRPRSSQDVSTTVWLLRTLSRYQALLGQGPGCTFAIRGGGHTPWPGSANIDGGVTIDLSRMKDVSVSDDRTLTAVGPGAKWMDVYLKLDALGLAVSGGRVSDVGVAGLTTGGPSNTLVPPFFFSFFFFKTSILDFPSTDPHFFSDEEPPDPDDILIRAIS